MIESDPNFKPLPPPLSKNELPARPLKKEIDYSMPKFRSQAQRNTLQVAKEHRIQIEPKDKVLAGEIQEEIDQTKKFYDNIGQKYPQMAQLTNAQLRELVRENFSQPLDKGGIAFNTRQVQKSQEYHEFLEEQNEIDTLRGPATYRPSIEF